VGKPNSQVLDDLHEVRGVTDGDIGDFGNTRSLRLQVELNRDSKFMETPSNIRKHVSSTEDQITSSLK
jgi:hypothetical protein